MKIYICGNGAFGTFLKELLSPHCELVDYNEAQSVILAVPASAYDECGRNYGGILKKHIVNVCSIQKSTTDTLLKYTDNVTSIHPLFGKRTPADKRNSIFTHSCNKNHDTWFSTETIENDFLTLFSKVSEIIYYDYSKPLTLDDQHPKFTPESHDILMAKTHATAVMAAKQLKVFTDRVSNVPDAMLPNSFRMMKQFVQTLDDMPTGTIDSIMANPYI